MIIWVLKNIDRDDGGYIYGIYSDEDTANYWGEQLDTDFWYVEDHELDVAPDREGLRTSYEREF